MTTETTTAQHTVGSDRDARETLLLSSSCSRDWKRMGGGERGGDKVEEEVVGMASGFGESEWEVERVKGIKKRRWKLR